MGWVPVKCGWVPVDAQRFAVRRASDVWGWARDVRGRTRDAWGRARHVWGRTRYAWGDTPFVWGCSLLKEVRTFFAWVHPLFERGGVLLVHARLRPSWGQRCPLFGATCESTEVETSTIKKQISGS